MLHQLQYLSQRMFFDFKMFGAYFVYMYSRDILATFSLPAQYPQRPSLS